MIASKIVNVIPWSVRNYIRKVPGVAALQRWVVKRLLRGTFDHRINAGPASGTVFRVSLPVDKQIWTGTYEPELAGAVRAAVRPGMTCLDVGAYRGFFGAVMAQGGASEVCLFEPNPRNMPKLEELGRLNPDLPLRFFDVALGAARGTAEFRVLTDNTMGKLAESPFDTADAVTDEVNRVAVETIDHLVETEAIGRPDVIKLDVEGAEADVLAGASELLRTHRPLWFIEAHTPALAHSCAATLRAAGYTVTRLNDGRAVEDAGLRDVSHLVARPA